MGHDGMNSAEQTWLEHGAWAGAGVCATHLSCSDINRLCWSEHSLRDMRMSSSLSPAAAAASQALLRSKVLLGDPCELEPCVRNESFSCFTSCLSAYALTPGACVLSPLLTGWACHSLMCFWTDSSELLECSQMLTCSRRGAL